MQSLTRGEIRRSIGKNLGIVIDGVATSTVDTSSLIDTRNLLGGDDEYNGCEVMIYDANCTTGITDGETSVVSDFTGGATNDATCSPVFSAAIVTGDEYELWKTPWRISDINDAINQAINDVTNRVLKEKVTNAAFTDTKKYVYDELTDFTHLYKVEYVYNQTEVDIDRCEVAWTSGTGTTTTADSSFEKEGTYCSKNVVASVSGTTILCYEDIAAINLTGYDKVEFWMYSSIAIVADTLQIHLSSTAAIASAEETINIPAMTAATWYRHSLSLENPHSDSAILSVGIYQVTDLADFTFYVDDVKAVKSTSRVYKELPIEHWNIARGSTDYLEITQGGLSITGVSKLLRLSGYQIPARLDADSTASDVDPAWVIARVTGRLLISHAKSASLDIHDRASLARYWLGEAARLEPTITTNMPGTTRII